MSDISLPLVHCLKEKADKTLKRGLEYAPKQALLPFSLLPKAAQEKALTWTINHFFKVELADEELNFLLNKWLKITITDVNYHCFITVNEAMNIQQCKVTLHQAQAEDVAFEAHSVSLLQLMGQTVDPDTLFFQRKLLITGDTELGLEIKNFLDDLDRSSFPYIIKQLFQKYKVLSN
ncbi:ubiquinone anaerobic biosynthesis accessory factor UbiT [Thalassotalea profundi]|uniref:ubiquinone anaerobic biosynthesis accessory factor UbiT n=1 Tax=Thalassotalea profundi TaxID=2036687 RepID=UPI00167AA0F2|nr:SCP2 sterol-binding domain-containing protein [Thalassotalea profundi]